MCNKQVPVNRLQYLPLSFKIDIAVGSKPSILHILQHHLPDTTWPAPQVFCSAVFFHSHDPCRGRLPLQNKAMKKRFRNFFMASFPAIKLSIDLLFRSVFKARSFTSICFQTWSFTLIALRPGHFAFTSNSDPLFRSNHSALSRHRCTYRTRYRSSCQACWHVPSCEGAVPDGICCRQSHGRALP